MMPMGFIKKYSSYVTNLKRYRKEDNLSENKELYDYYGQVKYLKQLMTEEEKTHMLNAFKKAYEPDIVSMDTLEREKGDYMKR